MSTKVYDVLIIGGGPAGLSLAGGLARQLHTAIILDSEAYRNERTKHMHNVPGWDHRDPADFRAKVRHDLTNRYASIDFQTATVQSVRKLEDGFEAVDENGVIYKGKKLGLATGVRDLVDDEVDGYSECWGRGIYHCMFCEGFEHSGIESAGLLATTFLAADPLELVGFARTVKRLADRATIYTNGNEALVSQLSTHIKSSKINVNNRLIARFSLVGSGPQVRIDFADGSAPVTEGFIASHPRMEQRAGNLVKQLGLEMTDSGDIKLSSPLNETSVKGCFAAGDAANVMKSAVDAIHMGFFAGVGCTAQLQEELEARDEL